MKSPRSTALCRLAAASLLASLLALGDTGTATAAAPAEAAAPLVVSPSAAGAGNLVTVRAACLPSGPARSEAFEENVALRQTDDGTWTGVGRVRASGLQIGRGYQVTVLCADGVTLDSTLSVLAGAPDGYLPGHPAPGDDVPGTAAGAEGDSRAPALAVGGGVAGAGALCYLLLARRRARLPGD